VIRAVIDTNVLVSVLLTPNRNEALVLQGIEQCLLRVCLSPAIYGLSGPVRSALP
jgi:predicted nucleic acid-binding protein